MTEGPAGTERLAKRVAAEQGLSRSTAESYIEGGFVRVDGAVVEAPGARVAPQQRVQLAPDANLAALEPVTLLLHKPPGFEAGLGLAQAGAAHASRSQGERPALSLLGPASHMAGDAAETRVLQRHFRQLECFTPLPTEASGLVVYTQDKRIARKLQEDIETLEQVRAGTALAGFALAARLAVLAAIPISGVVVAFAAVVAITPFARLPVANSFS